MSKFAILKELTDIKAIAQRKSMLTKGALAVAAIYFVFGVGRDGFSYLSTASRMLSDKVRSSVPLEFELERARTMISGLIPDVRENMLLIAQEEVSVENARLELAQQEAELVRQRDEMVRLRGQLAPPAEGEQPLPEGDVEEVKRDLTRRFARFQLVEATVASQKQLLAAREQSLDAGRAKLGNMLDAKRDLEVQVETLQAQLKTKQSQTLTGSIEFDDSQVAKCQKMLSDIRIRLAVADRLFAGQGDIAMMTNDLMPTSDDIGTQIDRYFAPSTQAVGVVVGN